VASAAVVGAAWWVLDRVEVVGASMSPTYEEGDRLLLVRRYRALRPGDLVALRDPRDASRTLVKRVVDVDGDGVTVRGDNGAASTDSRAFGAVPARAVTHLVAKRYHAASAS